MEAAPPSLADASRRRFTLATGVEIAALEWAPERDGAPLALLHHANGFCAATLALLAQRLRSHYRVVAVDARGHGDSSRPEGPDAYAWARMADDLAAVAERLCAERGEDRVALGVGHSFGGTLTAIVAGRHPERFGRVALVDPVLRRPEEIETTERGAHVTQMAERARRRRDHWPSAAEARAWFAERTLFERWLPEAIDLYVAEGLHTRPDGSVELKCPGEVEGTIFASGVGMLEAWENAARMGAPTLLLWASGGNFARGAYEAFAERAPGARVETLEAGHLAPMEAPDLVAERILAFGRTNDRS